MTWTAAEIDIDFSVLVRDQCTNCDVHGGANDDTLGSQLYTVMFECCGWAVERDLKVFTATYCSTAAKRCSINVG